MWPLTLTIALCGCVLYPLLKAIYSLTLHPLAKFPGSPFAAATKWYEFYFDICKGEGGQYAWEIQRMHAKYGPIIRINPDELHVEDSRFFNTIYAPFPARRDKWAPAASMTGSSKGSFGTIDHFAHRKRRAANSPLFTTKAITDAQSRVYGKSRLLCDAFAEHCKGNTVFQVQVEILAFTTDVMTEWILGRPLGCQADPVVAKSWYATTQVLPRVTPLVKQFPWLVTIALRLPLPVVNALVPDLATLASLRKSMYTEYTKHHEAKIKASLQSDEGKSHAQQPNIFQIIDNSNLPAKEKDIDRQAQEAFVLVAGGTETTARTITACLFQLVTHPKVLARLRADLIEVMPDPHTRPPLKTLEQLPYLAAVLKENLRTMQLITSRFPLQAHDELEYGGWKIPRMTPISMTISEVLLDEEIYDEPRVFKPERWLHASEELIGQYNAHFVPFGRGTRSCQGQGPAWAMMNICVAQIVRRFDLSLFDTTYARDFAVQRDCFLGLPGRVSKGIRMQVVRDYAADCL